MRSEKMYDEITYPFQNFNGCTVEAKGYLSTVGLTLICVSKGGPSTPFY